VWPLRGNHRADDTLMVVGIGPILREWIRELNVNQVFQNQRIADLGPQDVSGGRFIGATSTGERPWSRDFYESLGCAEHVAFDFFDKRATPCDFNSPPTGGGDFGIVTNFGTSEHIFNQFAIMKFAHELIHPGGLILHSLPAAGGRDHGFYNYHPSFFWELARANGYEVVSFVYVPHYRLQSEVSGTPVVVDLHKATAWQGNRPWTYEALIRKASIRTLLKPKALIFNMSILWKCIRNPNHGFGPFFDFYRHGDYVHVALRKKIDCPFQAPNQSHYLALSTAISQ